MKPYPHHLYIEAQQHYATASDGTRIAYWISGSGPGVLLISGQAVTHTSWQRVAANLPGRTVIAFDHRGTGQSDKGDWRQYSTQLFADDATTVIAAAGFTQVDVMGHSMGGRVAQWLALNHPDRVRRLVLAATTLNDASGEARSQNADEALRSGKLSRLRSVFFLPEDSESIDLFHITEDKDARVGHFRASKRHDTRDAATHITQPTLVIHGALDELTHPSHGEALAHAIPRARKAIIKHDLHGTLVDGGVGLDIARQFINAGY
ncbi:alpha/beta fold hydrolase [Jonesia quinghaiensis]|uniref:alpha/beta fold hydrolase n=1 Tax=Jonesia quinghaiensis TaxID=262806 RepID=UPI0004250E33|nr:alpha/beta hydrolase [Jonesia quinghaiensis]